MTALGTASTGIGTPTATVLEAYATCEEITRREARNFSYGIRLLPLEKRRALSAIYALSRRIDDVGDGDLPADEKLTELEAIRQGVRDLGSASSVAGVPGSDPVLVALADVARRFPIPVEAFIELVDGVEMDVRGTSYETFDDLVLYCRRVAGTVGRLCLGVYGADDLGRCWGLADDLGVALQQTNILRDVREDLINGRIYLPAEDLERYGVTLQIGSDEVLGGPPAELARLVRGGAARASEWYARGLTLLDHLDRRSRACTGAMAGIYVVLNKRLADQPALMTTGRLSLAGREKALVAARALAGRKL